MQELLRNAGRQLEALLTPSSLLQVAAILVAVLLALWFGRQVRNTERAKAALVQRGFQARVTEAVLIVSPHITALVLVAAIRRRAARDQGARAAWSTSRSHSPG